MARIPRSYLLNLDQTHNDHDDDDEDDCRRPDVEPEEDEADDEDGGEGDAEHDEGVGPHREVLLVEDVVVGEGEDGDLLRGWEAAVDL